MHLQNLSIWRKIGLVLMIPFVVLILLPYAIISDKIAAWRKKRNGDW